MIVEFSRPSVNGRELCGNLVPFGLTSSSFGTVGTNMPWRAGANKNTVITFQEDVKVEGQQLIAGSFGLHMMIKEDGMATVIFNKCVDSWGSYFYDETQDALRVDVTSIEAVLTYEFTETHSNETTLAVIWGKKAIPIKIELETSTIVIQKIKNELTKSSGFSKLSWEQAAGYALSIGENEQALIWINDVMAGKFFSQKTFQNLASKGSILKALGQTEEVDKLLEEGMSIANTNELNTLGYQLLGQKNYEKAITAFELNVKNNPTDPNAFDSLEEGYKQAGDKENTIKNLKNSFSEP